MKFKSFSLIRIFAARLVSVFSRRRTERDLSEELESALQLNIEDNVRSGMPPEEARRAALIRFGPVDPAMEALRDQRAVPVLEHAVMAVRSDLRTTFRNIVRNPGPFLVTFFALALGIGATTAALSVVDGLFFRPLPGIGRSQQLVSLYTDNLKTPTVDYGSLSYVDYVERYRSVSVFSGLAAYARWPIVLDWDGRTDRLNGETVSGNYFEVLEARPLAGRFLSKEDDTSGSASVAVISHRLWTQAFGASLETIGKTIRVNGRPVSVVGVAPEGFTGVNMDWYGHPDVWLPMSMQPQLNYGNLLQRPVPWHLAIGRLREGVSAAQAQAALRSTQERDAEDLLIVLPASETRFFPGNRTRFAAFTGSLAGIAGLLLLIAAFNAANLQLVRLLSRTREFAIRLALGAKRWQLARQVAVENALVALAAGAAGLWIAGWTPQFLNAFPQPFRISVADIPLRVDLRLGGLAFLVAAGVALLLSIVPWIQLSGWRVSPGLKTESAIPRVRFGRMSLLRLFLLLEVAVGMILATTATLGIRSVQRLSAVAPGFQTQGLYASNIDVASLPAPQRGAFFSQLQDALHALPDLTSVTVAGETLGGNRRVRKISSPEAGSTDAVLSYITPGYFETVGIPLLQGEELSPQQTGGPAVIVNDVIAAKYWPGEAAIGKLLRIAGETSDREVRGVVRFAKCGDIEGDRHACLYLPLPQSAPQALILFKPRHEPDAAIAAIRDQVRRINTNVALYGTESLAEQVRNRYSGQSLLGGLATILSLSGLVILAVGAFALVSFTIGQSGRSIGIRLAVGATPSRIIGEFLKQMGIVAGVGVALGLAGVLALGSMLRSQLYQVSPRDPVALAAAAALLCVTTLGACFLGTRRVTRIDPATTLHRE